MASICSAMFAVQLPITATCSITLDDATIKTVHDIYSSTKTFTYMIGPEPDGSSPNYGFDLTTTGMLGGIPVESSVLNAAVSVAFRFKPTTPQISGPAESVKNGSVEIVSTIDWDIIHRHDASVTEIDVTHTITMNTGT